MLADFSYVRLQRENCAVGEDVEKLKQRLPLLALSAAAALDRSAYRSRPEFVGLCPLHPETHPSFYVNARKNLFYCHGCGQGGDLLRFVQLSRHLSFRQSVAYLEQQSALQLTLPQCSSEPRLSINSNSIATPRHCAILSNEDLRDPALIKELRIGYAPGGSLRRHLTAQGYSFDLLQRLGLLNAQGCDAFYQRVIFRAARADASSNLYGRSVRCRLRPSIPTRLQGRLVRMGIGSPVSHGDSG